MRAASRAAFEETYGPSGGWAALFTRAEGYCGTELLRGADGAYLTIDRWRSRADFDAFLAAHRADYEARPQHRRLDQPGRTARGL